jgi:hypothetical protein
MKFQVEPKAGFTPAVTQASNFQAPPSVAEEQVGAPRGRTLYVLPRAFSQATADHILLTATAVYRTEY